MNELNSYLSFLIWFISFILRFFLLPLFLISYHSKIYNSFRHFNWKSLNYCNISNSFCTNYSQLHSFPSFSLSLSLSLSSRTLSTWKKKKRKKNYMNASFRKPAFPFIFYTKNHPLYNWVYAGNCKVHRHVYYGKSFSLLYEREKKNKADFLLLKWNVLIKLTVLVCF